MDCFKVYFFEEFFFINEYFMFIFSDKLILYDLLEKLYHLNYLNMLYLNYFYVEFNSFIVQDDKIIKVNYYLDKFFYQIFIFYIIF